MKFLKAFVTFAFLMTTTANAGLLVEPYLGYSFGSAETNVSNAGGANGTYDIKASGYRLGGRLGYQFLGFMGGVDYGIGAAKEKISSIPNGTSYSLDDYNVSQLGIFAGYELPILFRFWATYYTSYKMEVDGGSNNGDEDSGSGFGLGAGFTGLPFVSLNLEYKSITIDETEFAGGGSVKYPTNQISERDINEIVLSVSLPLDF